MFFIYFIASNDIVGTVNIVYCGEICRHKRHRAMFPPTNKYEFKKRYVKSVFAKNQDVGVEITKTSKQ